MKLSEIKPNPENPRTISDDDFDKLKNSVKDLSKMLRLRPIIIDKDNVIVAGNQRYRALQSLGKSEIPDEWVQKADDFSKAELRRFIVQDNVESGDWDFDKLANEYELPELEAWGVDLPEYLTEDEEVEEDEAPEVSSEPPVSQLGVVYQLGRHRVMCGDSSDFGSVSELLDGIEPDMIYTDPPYGNLIITNAKGEVGSENVAKTGKYHKYKNEGDFDFKPIWEIMNTWECKKLVWGGNYFPFLPITTGWIVWDKRAGEKSWFSDCELAWTNFGITARIYAYTWQGMIREGEKEEREHPTQKPFAFMGKLITEYGKDGDKVLDLFGGSGSTLLACEQLDRTAYLMELDPHYVDVIRKRYAKYTEQEDWAKATPMVSK